MVPHGVVGEPERLGELLDGAGTAPEEGDDAPAGGLEEAAAELGSGHGRLAVGDAPR